VSARARARRARPHPHAPRAAPSPNIPASPSPDRSGGRVREDGKVEYGFALMRGKRGAMEDYHHASFMRMGPSGEQVGCLGVFDGHGGPDAASFVCEHLFKNIVGHAKFGDDPAGAMEAAFRETDAQYLGSAGAEHRDDGCTAVAAVVRGQELYLAHVGDSRAVLFRDGGCVQLSEDHKPNRPDERQRIEDRGGVVIWAGTWRVGGVLAVSRAFGDRMLKEYVVADPDVRHESLSAGDLGLVLATDGVWDVITNEQALEIVGGAGDSKEAARKLAEEAYARGSNDNISCIVARFHF